MAFRPNSNFFRHPLIKSYAIYLLGAIIDRLLERFWRTGNRQYLDWAISSVRLALNSCPHGFPVWPLLTDLAQLRSTRYELWSNPVDLERAITLGRDAVKFCPRNDEQRYMVLSNLACSLSLRNEHCGKFDDLDEIINLGRAVLAHVFKGNHRPGTRIAIGSCSQTRSERSGIYQGSSMKRNGSGESVHWAMTLNNLAVALRMRFKQTGNAIDLDESIGFHRDALNFHSEGHPDRPISQNNLATALRLRFEQRGRKDDLLESIQLHRAALTLRPNGHPHRSSSLCDLAHALNTCFDHYGRPEDLNEAIQLSRVSLALCPEGDLNRGTSLNNLANALRTRYEQSGNTEDLEESIRLHRDALDLCSDGDPERYISCGNLGTALCTRFGRNGDMDDLNDSIQLLRESLGLLSKEHLALPSTLSRLAIALQTRFEQLGREEDLSESVQFHRGALALLPEGHAKHAEYADNLAATLCLRFEQRGVVEDLNESISLHRKALQLRPEGHPDRYGSLHNLANALGFRFDEDKRADDLDESIQLLRGALALLPNECPDRSLTLNNLANALQNRFTLHGNAGDLDASIQLHRDVLALRPEGHPGRPVSLGNLGCALLVRFEQSGREEDLNDSIRQLRGALALRPEGHPDRSSSLCNVANALGVCFKRHGHIDDSDESIKLYRDALAILPEGHPYYSDMISNLAIALDLRFERIGKWQDYEDCIKCLSAGATYRFSSSLVRLKVAYRWASIARQQDHTTTLIAYRTSLTLLERTLAVRPTLSTRHDLLVANGPSQTLAVDAASYAIEEGNLTSAVELLEQGRALLWSQMRGLRSPLERLSETNRTLAERFATCSGRLEALMTSSESGHAALRAEGPNSVDAGLQRARQLADELEGITEEIRHVSGFEDFLQAAPFDKLQQAALEGPVIVVNHSKFRCDALIILSGEDEPCVCVPLDVEWFEDALNLCHDLVHSRYEYFVHSAGYDETLRRVMKVLWDRVVSKVVGKLRELGVPSGSRIWWCPTRFLTALPFHAAGPYTDANGNTKHLLDDYISSYTPTLRSLIAARTGTRIGAEKLLFVGDAKLASMKKERDVIRKWRRITKCLLNEEASGESVLRELPKARWVHFACHGTLDMEKPFESSFALPGGKLTLLDIARARLPNAELAFLSACHTAEQSPNFAPDEVLHLAAGMQFCGFRSVVGTMWQLLDRDGPLLAEAVYAHLTNEAEDGQFRFKSSASAVRQAALFLRSQKDWTDDGRVVDIATERWVNLVHIGA